MKNIKSEKPVVLVFGGHDPSGSAGIQADIETIAAHRCHAVTVITMLTTQTIDNFYDYKTPDIDDFRKQSWLLLESLDVKSIKIGAIGNLKILETLVEIISEEDSLPVVLDPVLSSTSGFNLADQKSINVLLKEMIPLVDVLTPNSHEARLLTKADFSVCQATKQLLDSGCQNILLTGTHEDTQNVINTHYMNNREPVSYEYSRLPGEYRGSGCILSSSIAANLALGIEITTALHNALDYTWNCLQATHAVNETSIIPDRIAWKLKE